MTRALSSSILVWCLGLVETELILISKQKLTSASSVYSQYRFNRLPAD